MNHPSDSVEAAIIQRLKEARRERPYKAYEEAAADPECVAEMSELDRDFDVTIADGLDEEDRARKTTPNDARLSRAVRRFC